MTDKKRQRGFVEQACMQTAAGGSAGEHNWLKTEFVE